MSGYIQKQLSKIFQKEVTQPPVNLEKRCRIIAPATRKGGSGKSVTMVSMAACLAEMGYKVLLVDLDDSGDATFNIGGSKVSWEFTIADVLNGEATIHQALAPSEIVTQTDGCVWFLGGGLSNQTYARDNAHLVGTVFNLRDNLEKIKEKFDFVLLDPPPAMGFWNLASICAADYLISPVSGPAELTGFRAMRSAIEKVAPVNSNLKHLGAFITMSNTQTVIYKDIKKRLDKETSLFSAEIPMDTKIKEAFISKMPVTIYAPNSRGAQAYRALTREVLEKCAQLESPLKTS